MTRGNWAATLLFWLMALTGGVCLAACMLLPPWFEYRAALQAIEASQKQVAALEKRLESYERQIDHLQHDPAYLERVARKELGVVLPGVESILIEPTAVELPEAAADEEGAALGVVPEVDALVARMLHEYPLTRMFVLDQTRPMIMFMSGVLLLTAIIFLTHKRLPAPHTGRPPGPGSSEYP